MNKEETHNMMSEMMQKMCSGMSPSDKKKMMMSLMGAKETGSTKDGECGMKETT